MSEDKPVVYILRGDDREAIESHIDGFYGNLGKPNLADMNTSRLEGKSIDLNDLRAAALALPFLAQRRLVVVEDALKPYNGRGKQQVRSQLLSLLDSLPETTALVLVTPDTKKYSRGAIRWETLDEKHWLIRWAADAGARAYVVDCALPTDREMSSWVRQKAVEMGGSFTPHAAAILAEYVGTDTQRATQEINKLLTYVNFLRPVDDDDVRRLTAQDQQGDIFALVDAIGSRDAQKAQRMLHLLLEESDFMPLFGMIIRQFRLILQAREIIDMGGDTHEVAKLLHQHSFVAQKLSAQSRQFDLAALEMIYHQLLTIDLDMKTGGMAGDLALDMLIAQLAN
jgi:DNA polymerase III subunit delta